MEHAREIDLIELAAQRLNAERQTVVLAHLKDCSACRTKLQDIQRTWDLLGAWQVQAVGHGKVAELPASAKSQSDRSAQSLIRFPGIRTAARIAAAIAVSVLIGYTGGRWSIRPVPTGAEMKPPPYFSVLGFDIGESFSSLVLQDEPSSNQES
jgi:anti-sigma factor RsiW